MTDLNSKTGGLVGSRVSPPPSSTTTVDSAPRPRRRTVMILVTTTAFVALSLVTTAVSGWSSEVTTANERIAGDFADNDLLQRARAITATNETPLIAAIERNLEQPADASVPPGITWEILDQTTSTVTVGVVYRESQAPSFLLPNPTPWGTACREFTVSPEATVDSIHVVCPPGFGEPLTDGRPSPAW